MASFHCLFGEFDGRYVFLIRNTRPDEGTLLLFGWICEELDSQVVSQWQMDRETSTSMIWTFFFFGYG
jgi:hypothetical protein